MPNPRIADRYAKSLIDLSIERGQLEEVYRDANLIIEVCKRSRDFAIMLKSPIIKGEKKAQVINKISEGHICEISRVFLNLLVRKGRERFLQEIMQVVCDRYYIIKGISRINLTTAVPVADDVKKIIIAKLEKETELTNIELKTKVQEDLIGGFVLEYNNYLVDRSIKRFLNEARQQYKKNEYVYNIR
jgi:F-type H+-transporting ATPase subunit delta